MKKVDEYTCPHCGVDLRGNPIPPEHQELYGGKKYFNRKIGISDWDSVYEYQCPDCSGVWPVGR